MIKFNYILNDLALSSLVTRNLYSQNADCEDKEELENQIKLIMQENTNLKIQINAREEEYKKLENDWNELKRWLYEDNYLYIDMVRDNSTYTKIFKKMQELERGVRRK